MAESFQPPAHIAPETVIGKIMIFVRFLADFHYLSCYRSLKKVLPGIRGSVIDVGCGNSPFRHLLTKGKTSYTGLDYNNAASFNYKRSDIVYFDGYKIPFADSSFDFVLCTEVLEHVELPSVLIEEVHRVLVSNGKAVFTVPWSARYHYIPFDYYRYTPSGIKTIFRNFKTIDIQSRGTDVTVIGNKLIVLFARLASSIFLKPSSYFWPIKTMFNVVFGLTLLPIVLLFCLLAHISLIFKIGSSDDCLGYTIHLEK